MAAGILGQTGQLDVVGNKVAADLRGRAEPGSTELAQLEALDDSPLLHDGDVVSDGLNDVHFVRHDNEGDSELPVHVAQVLQHRGRRARVNRAGRLVTEQHPGPGSQGAGDPHALLLAAGELRRIARRFVGEIHDVQSLSRPAPSLDLAHSGELERELHVLSGGEIVEQIEVLEDHADVVALGAQLLVAQRLQFGAIHNDPAARRPLEQVDVA